MAKLRSGAGPAREIKVRGPYQSVIDSMLSGYVVRHLSDFFSGLSHTFKFAVDFRCTGDPGLPGFRKKSGCLTPNVFTGSSPLWSGIDFCQEYFEVLKSTLPGQFFVLHAAVSLKD